jgi:hypothetical protein
MESGKTAITMDQPTAMALRAVKAEMSATAGRVVTLPAVIRELIAFWRQHAPGPLTAADRREAAR